jgi:uncharacterized Zn finger protein
MSWYYKPTRAIETDAGIKAKSRRGKFVKSWWATRWIESLTRVMDAGRLRRGRTYARKGQVIALTEAQGRIEAKVQGSRRTPYKVTIALKQLSDDQWSQVLAELSGRAIFSAQLLAGEMPQEIESVFETAGVSLLPASRTDLTVNCSCPDYAAVCKHIAATHHILGERFDEDPFLIFRLRGRTEAQILADLRKRQGFDAAGMGHDSAAEPAPILEADPASFWGTAQLLTQIASHIKSPNTPMPLLQRLGQPNFTAVPLPQLLDAAYQHVTQTAISIAFENSEPDET